MVALIERKKAGGRHTPEELEWICHGAVTGEIPDYQLSAWLMAVCWRGMDEEEGYELTCALEGSGRTLHWPSDRPVVDKHSTGGVGDKTSIALVPLLAAAGICFVKMSGRGLGHTGGTLDKLESIPGYRIDLTLSELRDQVERIGCALVGQSAELAPADGTLYALRDVTGTIDSPHLIASSVMAKKLAGGAAAIVLDVKYGSGAFVRGAWEAEALAELMVAFGKRAGRRVRAVLTPMSEPLGRAVGNALEVAEAIEILMGGGPDDLRGLTLELGAHLMVLAGSAAGLDEAKAALDTLLRSGVAADKLAQLIEAQGGDARVVAEPERLPRSPLRVAVEAPCDAWVARVDARLIAEAALQLGAGRRTREARVDPRTGVRLLAKRGDAVRAGEPIAELHAATEEQVPEARGLLLRAYEWSEGYPDVDITSPLVVGS